MSHADLNGLSLHYDEHGTGDPLVLLHGGLGAAAQFAPILDDLAAGRRVIAVDLPGHGRSTDVERPLRPALMADDIAALIAHLGLARADVMGYSLGGEVALRTAIQHPDLVRRLVLVGTPCRRSAYLPDVLAAMDAMGPEIADMMVGSPPQALYASIAPDPDGWRALVARTAEALKDDFDWTAEVAAITAPVLLAFADADSIAPAHMAEMYTLLGGGLRDAGPDGSGRPVARLAVLPGTTHYDVSTSPALVAAVTGFLDA
jgi:pimeloyl-ACP methyl ester carboxylesterase